MRTFYEALSFVEASSATPLLGEVDREVLAYAMSIHLAAGMNSEDAFDKAWANVIGL